MCMSTYVCAYARVVCVYVYISIYTCVHVHIHIHMCTYSYTHVYIFIHICTCTGIYVYMYVQAYMLTTYYYTCIYYIPLHICTCTGSRADIALQCTEAILLHITTYVFTTLLHITTYVFTTYYHMLLHMYLLHTTTHYYIQARGRTSRCHARKMLYYYILLPITTYVFYITTYYYICIYYILLHICLLHITTHVFTTYHYTLLHTGSRADIALQCTEEADLILASKPHADNDALLGTLARRSTQHLLSITINTVRENTDAQVFFSFFVHTCSDIHTFTHARARARAHTHLCA